MNEKYSPKPNNPGEYLDLKLETTPLSDQQLIEFYKKMCKPIERHETDTEGAEIIHHHLNKNDVRVSYAECLTEQGTDKDVINKFLHHHPELRAHSIIRNFSISRGKDRLEQSQIVPEGCIVLVCEPNESSKDRDYFDDAGVIVLAELYSTRRIITLFHEAAHAEMFDSMGDNALMREIISLMEDAKRQKDAREAKAFIFAAFLKQERDAWALALKYLRPFIGNNDEEGLASREDIKAYIHNYCLSYYGWEIAEALEEQLFV
jgi:hypothetical protein